MASMNTKTMRRVNAVLFFLLIMSLAVVAYSLVLKANQQFDWTQTQRNTLSEKSIAVIAEARTPLTVTAYARESSVLVRKAIVQLVDRYRRYKDDITLSFVDPDAEPQLVRDLNIEVDGEMVLSMAATEDGLSGEVTEHIKSLREQAFSSGLQRLLRQGDRWLAFIVGHGERKSAGKANHDLAIWSDELKSQGFNIANVNLSKSGGVPGNVATVIIAGSQLNWLPGEIDHLLRYVDGGGNLLWLTEPNEDAGLTSLADHLAIKISKATVIDPLARLVGIDNPTFSVVANYPDHPLWQNFEATTLFPQITAVTANEEGGQWQHKTVLRSGEQSWLERGDLTGNVRLGDDDTPGPISIALSIQRQISVDDGHDKKQRIIVVGDGDFISNQYIGNAGNLELGLRLTNWLSADDNLVAIPTVERGDRALSLTLLQSQIIAIGLLIVIPVLLLLSGAYIWWRRRRLSV